MTTDPESCWFCDDERADPPPGGWLVDDGVWRVGHAPPTYAVAGTVIVETRRHVTDESGFDARESASYAATVGRVIEAMRAATGCDRVYHWATMDRYAHFHLWLVPWWETSELRGPRYLVASVVHTDGCSADTALDIAARLREMLDP